MKWKRLTWLNPRYEVSNTGLVRNPKKLRRTFVNKYGYVIVTLCIAGKLKNFLVHRLVLRAFTGKEGKVCNHKNGIRSDNRLRNLEWSTISANQLHSYRMLKRVPHWLGKYGAAHVGSKPVMQLSLQKKVLKIWASARDAARYYAFDASGICKVCRNFRKQHQGFMWRYAKKLDNAVV